ISCAGVRLGFTVSTSQASVQVRVDPSQSLGHTRISALLESLRLTATTAPAPTIVLVLSRVLDWLARRSRSPHGSVSHAIDDSATHAVITTERTAAWSTAPTWTK